jgi:hypothetical protein
VAGYVNQGRFGVKPCFVDPAVPRPRFKVSCPVAADDESAAIELVYARPGRVLTFPMVQVLARKAGLTSLTYLPPALGPETPAANSEGFAAGALAALNEIRREAGLTAVRLAPQQSATVTRVVEPYFAAAGTGGVDDMELIALGLLAGWNVTSGMIRDGSFATNFVPLTRDPSRWLAATLARPHGRVALLGAGTEEIALGAAFSSAPVGVGGLVVGYQFHNSVDHSADERAVLERITTARRKLKLSPPQVLPAMAVPMRQQLGEINAGKIQPLDALGQLLETAVQRGGTAMRGYTLETTSLEAFDVPEEVLAQPNLQIQIGVTHHKPPGAAWGQLVILVVFADTANVQKT